MSQTAAMKQRIVKRLEGGPIDDNNVTGLLMSEFGGTRGPLRDALRQLEEEGVTEMRINGKRIQHLALHNGHAVVEPKKMGRPKGSVNKAKATAGNGSGAAAKAANILDLALSGTAYVEMLRSRQDAIADEIDALEAQADDCIRRVDALREEGKRIQHLREHVG